MEESESDEWEIQDYRSLKGDEPSTVKWILNKGCWIGKKMVITGIVFTSAPIVVPPLVVVSAMGIAFSVPFGLVLASYACTEKLMSTLLPSPPSPLMLEYYGDDYDQEKGGGVACRFEFDDGAGDYNEKGYFIDEYEDYDIARENVTPEEEQEQIGDVYVQETEALVANENGYYTDEEENVVDSERTEDLNQGVDTVFELDDDMRQGEAFVLDVDEKGYNSSEYEGNEHGNENVMQEDEEERISDVYGNEVEALVSHVDEDAKEEGYYTDEEEIEEIEGTDDKLGQEMVDNEHMKDTSERVDIVLDLDDGGNDTGPLREAVVFNLDEKSYYTYKNDDEREMEDHVLQMENATIEEEEREQIEDIDQGLEMRHGLDVAADECKQTEVETNTNIGGSVDDKRYEEESEQMEDIKQAVEMRLGLDVATDECKQTEEETITNIGGSVDDKRYEEESEQMKDIKQGVEMSLGSDVAPDERKQTEEETITNIGGSVDDKRYEEEREQMEDIEQGVEMRLGLDVAADECNQTEVDTNTNISGSVDERMYEDGSEQMEDIKQGVEMRLGLDGAPDECKQAEEETIADIGVSVDKRYEEECEQMEDIKQGAETRLGLDVAPDECKPTEEEKITNIGGSVDDTRYEEESEQMEDIKQGVEMRLGLDVAPDECKQTEEGTITSIDGSVDDKGYEEDVGESLEGDVDSLEEEQRGNELSIESHLDENISNTPVVTLYELYDKEKEASGVARVDYSNDEDGNFIDDTASNVILEEVTNDETADPVTQKLFENGSKNEEPVGEMRHIVVLASGNEDNNFNAREVEEIDLVAREVCGDANKHERDMKSGEEVIRESMGTQEKFASDVSNGVTEDATMETKKEHLTNVNADAREIGDESGLDLFDAGNTNIYFDILEAGDEAQKNTFSDDVDFVALPAFRRASLDTDDAKPASKVYTKMSPREDILDEEKIWEKIGAMRAIVGYKAPSQPTSIGELKALYVFTGVEPPASYKGDSDLDEVNAKLKFLMSIVGVK